MPKHGEELTFNKKTFTYDKPLGSGGTGSTHLVKDVTTDMCFAVKKYVPYEKDFHEELYKRFVDEIKILFLLSHPNIVRVYNYYLYPDQQTGYIQMEYVQGTDIHTYFDIFSRDYEEIFIQVINGFMNLEKNGILHRDIRPANIMVTYDGIVKIIDFGFGKKLEDKDDVGESVLLNWPVSVMPDEVDRENKYTTQTEIYFIGQLFRNILRELSDREFKYQDILDKMTQPSPDKRFKSFSDILEEISKGTLSDLNFSESDKAVYRQFADTVLSHLSLLHSEFVPVYDVPKIINAVERVLHESSLEKYIQANKDLLSCFVNVGYNYNTKRDIEVVVVKEFYELLKAKKPKAQRVVLDNLYTRIATVPVRDDDDLPF